MDFGLLFIEETDQVIVLLDGFDGLDKDGLPARAGTVHHPRNSALLLDLHGDDEALAANSDEFVLQGAALGEPAQVAAQGILNGSFLLVDVAADAS